MNTSWCLRTALAVAALVACGAVAAQAAGAGKQAAVDAVFAKWDADHDGVLSRQEFRDGWQAQARIARTAAMEAVQQGLHGQFEAVDANDDQAIDASEYPSLLLVRRAGAAAPALAEFDASRDGRLQFEEYLALVRRLAPTVRKEGP